MKTCMQIDKPLVSILLAVYKPNEKWLIEQLKSLNEQTYENLNLYIYDDCPNYPIDEKLFKKYITKFNYKLIRGELNAGSNIAFEELTKIADGEYFAYCDQDDIWENNKISIMMDKFTDKEVTLVCCDLSIINQNGFITHNSIRDIRKRLVYKSGDRLAKDLILSNYVTGCAMIVKRNIALKAIPFESQMVHDNWIAIVAAINGKIEFVDLQLVKYRQHENNQTGILKGVVDKSTYYEIKIVNLLKRYENLKIRLSSVDDLNDLIDYCICSLNVRKVYFYNNSFDNLKAMIKYSKYYKLSIILEIFSPIIHNCIFKIIIKLAKKNII